MIKGPLERFIRDAYFCVCFFWGNIGAYNKETKGRVNKAYHYEII